GESRDRGAGLEPGARLPGRGARGGAGCPPQAGSGHGRRRGGTESGGARAGPGGHGVRATVRNLPRARRPERRHDDKARAGWLRLAIFTMRPEEVITRILFVPVAIALAGVAANPAAFPVDPDAAGYPSAAARLLALIATVALTLWVVR